MGAASHPCVRSGDGGCRRLTLSITVNRGNLSRQKGAPGSLGLVSEALLPPRVHGSWGSRYVLHGVCSLWSCPCCLNGHLELGEEEELLLGWRQGHIRRGRMLGCICVTPCHKTIMENPVFCHCRLSQRVPYRPRVKLLPRRRTRRRTDM